MTPKLLPLLERCIQDGLLLGYARAYKHNDSPTVEQIADAQEQAILNEIHEWFEFEELQ